MELQLLIQAKNSKVQSLGHCHLRKGQQIPSSRSETGTRFAITTQHLLNPAERDKEKEREIVRNESLFLDIQN